MGQFRVTKGQARSILAHRNVRPVGDGSLKGFTVAGITADVSALQQRGVDAATVLTDGVAKGMPTFLLKKVIKQVFSSAASGYYGTHTPRTGWFQGGGQ